MRCHSHPPLALVSAIGRSTVGWGERSETHHLTPAAIDGSRFAHPCYGIRVGHSRTKTQSTSSGARQGRRMPDGRPRVAADLVAGQRPPAPRGDRAADPEAGKNRRAPRGDPVAEPVAGQNPPARAGDPVAEPVAGQNPAARARDPAAGPAVGQNQMVRAGDPARNQVVDRRAGNSTRAGRSACSRGHRDSDGRNRRATAGARRATGDSRHSNPSRARDRTTPRIVARRPPHTVFHPYRHIDRPCNPAVAARSWFAAADNRAAAMGRHCRVNNRRTDNRQAGAQHSRRAPAQALRRRRPSERMVSFLWSRVT